MPKARVYELAKELGCDSKAVLTKLADLGEFVRSASSTIEAPVVRKLRENMPPAEGAPATAPAKSAASRRAAPSAPATPAAPTPTPAAPTPSAERSAPPPDTPVPDAPGRVAPSPVAPNPVAPSPVAPSPVAPAPAATTPSAPAPAAPAPAAPAPAAPAVPGPTPSGPARTERPLAPAARSDAPQRATGPGPATGPGAAARRPIPARPGNNPFSSSPSGMGRSPAPQLRRPVPPGAVPGGPGGPGAVRPGGPRPAGPAGPGGPRPSPGGMPPRPMGAGGPRPNPGGLPPRAPRPAPSGRPGPGGRTGRPGGGFAGPSAGRPGGFAGRPGGGGNRPGGRGGTQGAFGRAGGKPARGRKSRKQKRQEFDNLEAPSMGGARVARGDGSTVRLARGSSLTDLGEKIGTDPAQLVKVLFGLGELVTATQSVNDETLQSLGLELNYDITIVSPEEEDRELLESFDLSFGDGEVDESDLVIRPPVVTVMGHVDHGKTKLLDAIRRTRVQEREAGGITQHIGAYQVVAQTEEGERPITFIDTPGHEAFTAMRARGAQTTDIVVLVVAADDGVKPQTIEALNHAQAAGVPIVVAVNKVDKEGADPSMVRGQLTEYNLVAEDFGGQTQFVDVSALTGQGIPQLLEAVVLTADAELDLRAEADRDAQGVAIEAHLDKGRGPVATMLVQRGTLRVGDSVVAGDAYGRVRALLDDTGAPLEEATPSRPAMVLGLTAVPGAGDQFLVVREDRVARQIAERRESRERAAQLAKRTSTKTLEDLMKTMAEGETRELLLVIKGDVSGSVEALEDALLKLDVGSDVELRVIHRGVGAITQNDVNLASIDNAIVIGFNVRPAERVAELAEREGVDIRFYTVIYQAIDEVEAALTGMLKPVYETVELGSAEIREIYRSSKFGNIAGCLVREGRIRRNAKARLVRDGAVVNGDLAVGSLRRFKDDATEVAEGYECGIGLGSFNDIRVGDTIETFEVREKART